MDKSTIINIIKFIGSKNPKYQIKFNDQGEYRLPNEGGYRDQNNDKQGKWVYYNKWGDVIVEGIYIDNKKEGEWTDYFNNGNILQKGNYKNNLKNGEWIYGWHSGGVKIRGHYKNNDMDGKWLFYDHETGKIAKIKNYLLGELHGDYMEYSPDEETSIKGTYENGLLEGKWTYQYKTHRVEGRYHNDEKDGEWIVYYKNGKIEKTIYKNGIIIKVTPEK